MRIRIKNFEVTNYRSCIRTSFLPQPTLSTLIGKNASGKSSLLNAILLLKYLAHEGPRTTSGDVTPAQSSLKVDFSFGNRQVRLRAIVSYSTSETSRDEIIGIRQKWNFSGIVGDDRWVVLPIALDDYPVQPFLFDSKVPSNLFLNQIIPVYAGMTVWKSPEELRQVYQISRQLRRFVHGISYYSASQFTDPTRCPVALEIEDERLRRRGQETGHSRFLHELYLLHSSRNESPLYDEFFGIIGPKGLKLVDDITFKRHELPQSQYQVRVGGKIVQERSRRLLIIPSVRVGHSRLSPSQLSEGTFKTLALLFYLVVDRGNLLLIEEPEVCVHHGLLNSIMDLIKSYSDWKQIVISTHSDFVLDSLKPENVFLVKKDGQSGTKVRAVTQALSAKDFKALKTYLAESGNLGEYWRHGGLEHGN